MRKFKKILNILTVLMLVLTLIPASVFAAKGSYSAKASKTTLTVGNKATLTIQTIKGEGHNRCPEGQFEVSSSNSAVLKVGSSSVWVGESGKATISLTAVKEGTATITITPVTVSDQEYNLLTGSKTIKVTVKKVETTNNNSNSDKDTTTGVVKSADANLKSLSSAVAYIDFSSNKTNYTVNVDKTVTSLGLKAVTNSSKATVKITGDKNFVTGENVVKAVVTAENGTQKTYTVTVVKSKYGHAPLLELEVEGYGLAPKFEPDKFEYSLDAIGVEQLELDYVLADKDSNVSIEGADELKVGNNEIKVIVTEKDGRVTTYKVNVNVANPIGLEKENNVWLIVIIVLVVLVLAEAMYIVAKERKNKEEAAKAQAEAEAKKATKKTTKKNK